MNRVKDYDLDAPRGKLRLYVNAGLSAGKTVEVTFSQAHYLMHVMRAREGAHVRLFNGQDGEWNARISRISKRACVLTCETRSAPQAEVPDLWLAFAPIKKMPADYVAQKATEIGVRVLQPVITRRTIARRVNLDRLRANAVEAAEQSGRLSVPEVRSEVELPDLLKSWPPERKLMFCDEGGDAPAIADALGETRNGPWGVLTGPEGGFDDEERARLRACSFVIPVSLGPRIMRADTAALSALAIWQALCGDWR